MRAIFPRWCAAAAPIRREIVSGVVVAVAGVRLPFVLPLRRRRRAFHRCLLSAATASPIMGSLNRNEEVAGEEKEKGKAPASEESQSQSQSQSPQTQKQKQKQLQAPEKPLPGDCCGSGCVRCVWDVYYEELDAYQKSLSSSAASNAKDN
ncbi:uncharacterized protein LOC109703597 [Ananas comosus]|uniref:Uncharacterized protein LOC109703597 n=1 Tax=Ananas comosus TaxID=4615 RepID=A0A6P5E9M4_ANACO|nr:uncharacterized protein LOC109703597 [Ananas comosus]